MTDIVARLRQKRGVLDNRWPGPSALDLEAADEIERLRAAAEDVCGWDTADDRPDFSRDIEALRKLLPPEEASSDQRG